jgi:hypothetical protein
MLFLAHHVEPHHVPMLLSMFIAGSWIGWQVTGRFLKRPAVADKQIGHT